MQHRNADKQTGLSSVFPANPAVFPVNQLDEQKIPAPGTGAGIKQANTIEEDEDGTDVAFISLSQSNISPV
jgi:hypothetical protein